MLKFHKANAPRTYVAYTDDYLYQVRKPEGEKSWRVSVWGLSRTAGVPSENIPPSVYPRDQLAAGSVSTKSLGYGVCQAYDALGDDYKAHEHGYRSRWTEAVLMAYDDDKTRNSPDVVAGLAAMRRGDVVEA